MKTRTCTKCGAESTLKSTKCYNCGAHITATGKAGEFIGGVIVLLVLGIFAFKALFG